MFHSLPGVPRAKMERFKGIVDFNITIMRQYPGKPKQVDYFFPKHKLNF